jgi:anthranilate synthase component 2
MQVLLIDNYDSFTYNLVHLLGRLEVEVSVVRNDELTVDDVIARGPDAIVISPGPSRPERAGISVELVRRLGPTIPILGVCLGHQAIGVAFGARVARVEPVHGKRSAIFHSGRGAFRALSSPIFAARYHSLAIDRGSIPAELEVTAWSPDGIPMAVAHRSDPIQGLQFHPESILTDDGEALVANFLSQAYEAARPQPAKVPT